MAPWDRVCTWRVAQVNRRAYVPTVTREEICVLLADLCAGGASLENANLSIGDRIVVRDASGAEMERVVVSLSEEGEPILASPREVDAANSEGRTVQGIGWPADAIVRRVEGNDAPA